MNEKKNLVFDNTCRACMKNDDCAVMLNIFNNLECGDDLAKIYKLFTDLEVINY